MITSSVADREALLQVSTHQTEKEDMSLKKNDDEEDPLDRLGAQVHPPFAGPLPLTFGGDDFEPNNVFTGPSVPSSISFPAQAAAPAAAVLPRAAPQVLPSLPVAPLRVHVHMLDRRKQFLVFVKILLKHLEKTSNEPTRRRVQQILQECTLKNRQGDPHYQPLHLAAESRILPIVGPLHWNRSVQYLNLYLQKQAQARTRHANVTAATSPTTNSAPPLSVPI
jgi:hypothetical protein